MIQDKQGVRSGESESFLVELSAPTAKVITCPPGAFLPVGIALCSLPVS